MGYLRVSDAALCVGVFCERTRNAIARFQRDHDLVEAGGARKEYVGGSGASAAGMGVDQLGVFCERTRRVILTLFQEVQARYSQARCRSAPAADPTRLRAATAA